MASTSETGHAKNAAFFDELISFAVAIGATYNPTKATLRVTALQALSTSAKNAISAVNAAVPAYVAAMAAREVAFEPLSKLTTRVINALKATDSTTQIDESARTLVRKIQGSRSTPKKSDEQIAALAAKGTVVKEASSSQMSYDSRLDNFDKLIKLLGAIPQYNPNEADLKVAALTVVYNDLKAKNTAAVTAAIPLSNARLTRNDLLYKTNTGLVDTALDVKTYIKSIYGASSPQYKQIAKLAFKNVN